MSCDEYVIWYRESLLEHHVNELEIMKKHFRCVDSRVSINPKEIVIGRYSVLPFYKEQSDDIHYLGAELINSHHQHCYVADIRNWYEDLKEYTPKTWTGLDWIDEEGPYVLKGMTNSRKNKWKTHMFAANKDDAANVYWELLTDPLLEDTKQEIVIRKFEKLYTYFIGVNGMPVTKEYRFFIFNGQVVSGGYYWSQYHDDLPEKPDPDEVPREFLDKIISLVGNKINFWLLDVGQKVNGEWIVIELGDAQMGGLSCNDPETLYSNMARVIELSKSPKTLTLPQILEGAKRASEKFDTWPQWKKDISEPKG